VYEAVFEACELGERAEAVRSGDPTMSRIAEARPPADQRERMTTIEVEVDGRWDALALSEALIPFHSFLVQHDRQRWVVHARVPGGHGEQLPDALDAIEGWGAEQSARAAACRVDGRPYQFPETRVAAPVERHHGR
jgi:hypothetical protein